jgi:hypothetical protein
MRKSFLHERFVGCCTSCSWVGGQCRSPLTAAHQAAHHSKKVHPEDEGFVGYVRRIRVKNLRPPCIAMRKGSAPSLVFTRVGGRNSGEGIQRLAESRGIDP